MLNKDKFKSCTEGEPVPAEYFHLTGEQLGGETLRNTKNQDDHKPIMCSCEQRRSTASWTTLRAAVPAGRGKVTAAHDSALLRPGVGSPENTAMGLQDWY